MSYAARTSSLGVVAHYVDDTGALCGARPYRGRWKLSRVMPVTCPRCLLALNHQRWAFCETPTAGSSKRWHIRLVGPEGVSFSGNTAGARTLCDLPVGWDCQPPVPPMLDEDFLVCGTCRPRYMMS